ncbi:SAM-dependent methyltransferase [Paenibacillus sp. YYML68]|uniref:SAM-dependent methyltransferase n=1 Tax=Paenibacillus sp. YYML68 TaxID=2909250 RepID=UPI002492D75F|nr:SAM-dependent methyltransferase [Paenibacillus sp. YYML68]
MSRSLFVCTSNRGYAQQAQEELRRLIGADCRFGWLAPGETFTLETGSDHETVLRLVNDNEPIFLRHLFPATVHVEWSGRVEEAASAVRTLLAQGGASLVAGANVAVQARKPEGESGLPAPSELKAELDALLEREAGSVPVVRNADWVLSIYMTGQSLYTGLARPEQQLSDWPGGAVRYRREDGQISRAKFKLLEAEQSFGLDLAQYSSALDVGAAPGGWTSLLLERGLAVTAVDPAKLDPSLVGHPRLTYIGKTADAVQFADGQFDLFVCDMSWSPRQMTKLVKSLLPSLQAGGTAIITVKLMHKKAFQTIREVVEDLSEELALQKAKQLFHNREELTLFFIRK